MSYRTRHPIHFAAMIGDLISVTRAIIRSPVIVDDVDDLGNTLLHVAAQFGYLDIALLLFDNLAEVQANNKSGFTPLHYAAENGEARAAEIRISDNLLPGLSSEWQEANAVQTFRLCRLCFRCGKDIFCELSSAYTSLSL